MHISYILYIIVSGKNIFLEIYDFTAQLQNDTILYCSLKKFTTKV